ncbi:MAG: phosphopantothenoylcysteine decarboxylase [Anaerohalosphaeraceae bacterium]
MMAASKKKRRILITAGGTREYIDPVRFLSNAGSGQMGYALARAALRAGHRVTLISAPTTLKPPAQAELLRVVSCQDMFRAVKEKFPQSDCLIMTAAVSDYTPVKKEKTKMKKSRGILTLRLKPTPDILAWAGRHKKKGQILVGFALEDKNLKQNAEQKLRRKNLDLIVANKPDAIAARQSAVFLKSPSGPWLALPYQSKQRTAGCILRMIEKLFAEN